MELRTGIVKWSEEKFCAGSVVRPYPAIAEGVLYARNEDTLVALTYVASVPRSAGHTPALPFFTCALLVSVGLVALSTAAAAGQSRTNEAQTILSQAEVDFLAGRVAESVKGFDRVVQLLPEAAAQLWQRGIALYYVGRYQDCRTQFEWHRTVNPSDVENPAWHFLCVARIESPAKARAALLPVGPDQRTPMREVYQMFQGTLAPEKVIAAAGTSLSGQFYAELYVGLYYEATGNDALALKHLTTAAAPRFASAGGYMHTVATLHPRVRAAAVAGGRVRERVFRSPHTAPVPARGLSSSFQSP